MTASLVSVLGHVTAGEAIEAVRVQGREVEDFYTVFVVDEDTKLLGTVPLDDLILSDTEHRIGDLVEPTVASVLPEADQEEVGHMIARYNLASIPVVSDDGVLLGRITFDDVIDVIEAETTEDLLLFSGVSEAEELRGGSFEAVRTRLPWLLLNTMTASLAAAVVWWFRSEIAAATLLAVVMPRGGWTRRKCGPAGACRDRQAARHVGGASRSSWPCRAQGNPGGVVERREPSASLSQGRRRCSPWPWAWTQGSAWSFCWPCGGTSRWPASPAPSSPRFSIKWGQDPAVASTVFLTALTDLTGFLLLLGLATVIL